MAVKNFEWVDGSPAVKWELEDGTIVQKHYQLPAGSVCVLIDRSGVAIVEPYEEVGKRNAVIYDEDGSERFRLDLPLPESEAYGFYYIHYESDKLRAVVATRSRDIAVTVDPESGRCFDLHETR
jgi:hypothetical protein